MIFKKQIIIVLIVGLLGLFSAGAAIAQQQEKEQDQPSLSWTEKLNGWRKQIVEKVTSPLKRKSLFSSEAEPGDIEEPTSSTASSAVKIEPVDQGRRSTANAKPVFPTGAGYASSDSIRPPIDSKTRLKVQPRFGSQVEINNAKTPSTKVAKDRLPSSQAVLDTIRKKRAAAEKPGAGKAEIGFSENDSLSKRINRFRSSPFDESPEAAGVDQATSAEKTDSQPIEEPTRPRNKLNYPSMDKYDLPNPPPVTEPKLEEPIDEIEEPTPDKVGSQRTPTPANLKSTSVDSKAGSNRRPSPEVSRQASDEKILLSRNSPNLKVYTLGRRSIAVGKMTTFEVYVENEGEFEANDVVVQIDLPTWVNLKKSNPTSGTAQLKPVGSQKSQLFWKILEIAPNSEQKLTLNFIPLESRPIDFAVSWSSRPVSANAKIEVIQPELVMSLEGPEEVFYGVEEPFQLIIANNGTGMAEQMVLTLMPLSPSNKKPTVHPIGSLKPGGNRKIDLGITARQPGHIVVAASLESEGSAMAKLSKKLPVRKAEVRMDVTGPQVQFIDANAIYKIRMSNLGNASAENLSIKAKLPPEIEFVQATHRGRLSKSLGEIQWDIDKLSARSEILLTFRGKLVSEGIGHLKVQADESRSDTHLTTELGVRIESVADMRMELVDPKGPVPVGDEATYEIHIKNRGSRMAKGIEVVAYFSQGVEPIGAEGTKFNRGVGQVVFDPIQSLASGQEKVLKVMAKASKAGNHMFRAELYCRTLDTKLVGEETTRYYQIGTIATGPRDSTDKINLARLPNGKGNSTTAPKSDHKPVRSGSSLIR
jgi:Domain of unknown function DUF11